MMRFAFHGSVESVVNSWSVVLPIRYSNIVRDLARDVVVEDLPKAQGDEALRAKARPKRSRIEPAAETAAHFASFEITSTE